MRIPTCLGLSVLGQRGSSWKSELNNSPLSFSLTKHERLSVLWRNHSSYLVPGLRATHVAQRLPPPSPSEPLGESGSSDISPPPPEDKNAE